jgi:hypothetical protein
LFRRLEFQQAEADGRTAWRVVTVKSPPLTPLPPFTPSIEKTVKDWSGAVTSRAQFRSLGIISEFTANSAHQMF